VVLIKPYLLFVFGNFGQVLNGFYETARMFEGGKIFRHLGRFVLSDGGGGGMGGAPDFSFQVF